MKTTIEQPTPVKTKIVLTRNFKDGETPGRYCWAVYGEKPETASVTDNLMIRNVSIAETYGDPKLKDFVDFGCGIVLVGELADLPLPNGKSEKIKWAGLAFKYTGTEREFTNCELLQATPDGLVVLEK